MSWIFRRTPMTVLPRRSPGARRFGQTQEVIVDSVMTEGERKIIENRQRKAEQAEAMFSNLISSMCNEMAVNPSRSSSGPINIPKWLEAAA